jgi:hypothetical protein
VDEVEDDDDADSMDDDDDEDSMGEDDNYDEEDESELSNYKPPENINQIDKNRANGGYPSGTF